MRVFLDTNILLDVIAQRDPFYQSAALLWDLAELGKVQAHISAISFNNIFYIVRRFAGKRRATEAIRLLSGVFKVVTVDRQTIDAAIGSGMDDFEDAIQYTCALRCKARYLVTRNTKDFSPDVISVVNAEEFLALFK